MKRTVPTVIFPPIFLTFASENKRITISLISNNKTKDCYTLGLEQASRFMKTRRNKWETCSFFCAPSLRSKRKFYITSSNNDRGTRVTHEILTF